MRRKLMTLDCSGGSASRYVVIQRPRLIVKTTMMTVIIVCVCVTSIWQLVTLGCLLTDSFQGKPRTSPALFRPTVGSRIVGGILVSGWRHTSRFWQIHLESCKIRRLLCEMNVTDQ